MNIIRKLLIGATAALALTAGTTAQARDHHHHSYYRDYRGGGDYYGGPRVVYRSYPRYYGYSRPYYYDDYYDSGPSYGYYSSPGVSIALGGLFGHHHHYSHHRW